MNITGTIKVIKDAMQVSATFKKRELVITTDEQYPQSILVEFQQDKCDLLNGYAVGQKVDVGINLRGREWINPQGQAVYFNSIQGWKIAKLTTEQPNANPSPATFEPMAPPTDEVDNDLPF